MEPTLSERPALPTDPQELIEKCRGDDDLQSIRVLLGVYCCDYYETSFR